MSFFNKVSELTTNLSVPDSFNSPLSKKIIIETMIALDYSAIRNGVVLLEKTSPSTQKLLPIIDILELAAIEYKESDSEFKDSEYTDFLISCIDAEQTLKEVEPFIELIPAGSVVVLLLRYIINSKNK